MNTDTTPGTSNHEVKDGTSFTEDDTSGVPMLLENATTEVSSVIVPPDHMRTVQNINALMAEVTSINEYELFFFLLYTRKYNINYV